MVLEARIHPISTENKSNHIAVLVDWSISDEKLPDEKTMQETLELAKDFEDSARKLCELSTAIAIKYQKRVSKLKQMESQEQKV